MADTEDLGSWSGVERVANEAEAALVVGFLKNHDIPARVLDKSFHQTPTSGEDLSPIEIAVPSERLEEARRILDSREAAYAASSRSDDTVMTDEGLAEIDPNAGDGEKNE
jgi:putative signal transducing protein